eukprot:TRINITY_DN2853_c0_g1_i1.p1 TRINITY_DN2853_c0_g1~~TRINITY_DN2853_c0_g1_i1.p1  ORF type:complete len:350 (-),score=56.42 TRINITY_DN2853_c0_g1_i1:74-1123(-)
MLSLATSTMRAVLLALVVVTVIATISAKAPPKWPFQYSTGFDTQFVRSHHNMVGRWFFDELAKKERIDVSGPWGYDVRFLHYDLGKAFDVRHLNEHDISCHETPLTEEMHVPDFSNFTYGGSAVVQSEPCDLWELKESSTAFQYYDRNSTFDPVQFVEKGVIDDTETFFFDFDRGNQEAQLFDVAYQFPGVQCTSGKSHHLPFKLAQGRLHSLASAPSDRFVRAMKRLVFKAEAKNMTVSPVRTVLDGQASWFCCNSEGQSGCGCGSSPAGACGACGASQYICATRFGPCGMSCTVTAKNSGRSVTVTRGDYGPAEWTGRIIDMNCGGAQALDMIQAGVIPVHISCNGA